MCYGSSTYFLYIICAKYRYIYVDFVILYIYRNIKICRSARRHYLYACEVIIHSNIQYNMNGNNDVNKIQFDGVV